MVTKLLSGKQLDTLQALSSWLESNILIFSFKTLLIVEIYG